MKKIISIILVLLLALTLGACDLFSADDIPDEILDCLTDPEAEGCEDIIPDPNDERSAEEILADTIIENWDGDITHLDYFIEALDFTDSMELQAEFNFEALDGDGVEHIINVVMTDSYLFVVGENVLHRHVSMNIDDELIEFTMIFEEVSTGVVIYLEISDIRDKIVEDNPEVGEVMTVVGIDDDWLKFSFDDSLVNMIEIEVMREMFSDIFFSEMGVLFFYELEDEIETETGLVLADYSLDIGLLMDTLALGDYSGFRTMALAVDYDTLLFDLDAIILVPEIVDFLTTFQTDFEAEGFDVVNGIIYIEANGTEAYLASLSEDDVLIFINILTAPDKLDAAMRKLEQEMPWQVISAINLPTEDLENNATITWVSYHPELITAEGVVTVPEIDMWGQWAGLVATITVNGESRDLYFEVSVPPVNAEGFGDEYHDYYYDDDERDDPLGDFLKETVDFYDLIVMIEDLRDNLLLIDFDALELETVDVFELKDAFYESQMAYDAFIVTLAATAPESALLLGTFSPVALYFEEYIFITDIRYAFDNLDMFEKYLTIEYYIDNSLLDASILKTDDFEIETTLELAPDAYALLFDNVLADVNIFLGGVTEFEIPYVEHVNCPIGETCEPLEGYDRIIERLEDISYLEMIALYDPSNPNQIQMGIDFTEFADAIVNLEVYDDELIRRAVDKLREQMPWQVISVIDLPTEDLENGATITWESDRPGLISAAGVVTAPAIDEWDQWVMLTATVTVGSEVEVLYFSVTVPPVNAEGMGDEYDYYNDNDGGGMDISSVIDLSLTITVKEAATAPIPETYSDLNAVAEDFARFSITIMAYNYLEYISEYYMENPDMLVLDTGTTVPLEHYVDEFYVTLAFDDTLSNVIIGGDLVNPEFSIELYWIDGTLVYTDPLTFAELLVVVGPQTGGPETNAIFQYYIDEVVEANFSMTKLLFVYIFNDTYDDDDEYYED